VLVNDLTGKIFGSLHVIRRVDNNKRGEACWECRCDCGNISIAKSANLVGGRTASCGCKRRGNPRDDSIIGQTFYGITVLAVANKDRHREWFYTCRCSCGNIFDSRRSKIGVRHLCPACRWNDYEEITRGYWSGIINGANARNIEFNISPEYACELFRQQNGCCALSGVPLSLARRHTRQHTASLDRIDNNKGYVVGNVQWVHREVNRLKGTMSQQRLIYWCQLISDHKG
jgi:hypothetical protein